jgi:hypothetical protein
MGEAKRKVKLATKRSWLTGSIKIEANEQSCFAWSGTKDEAIKLQKDYLQAVETWTIVSADSYAKRVAGYLIAFGMPKVGDSDQRPSMLGQSWTEEEIAKLQTAILWMVLHERVPNEPGQRVEDIFAGKSLIMALHGDKRQMLAETMRELNGEAFTNEAFTMMVGVLGDFRLDPDAAVTMPFRDLHVAAGYPPLEIDSKLYHDIAYVPRLPVDAAEAKDMLQMTTIVMNAADFTTTDPDAAFRTYVGYTNDELRRGKPAVVVE